MNFEANNDKVYNKEFTLEELQMALMRTKNTAPGPDVMNFRMLKEMPIAAKQHLLKMFKKYRNEGFFS